MATPGWVHSDRRARLPADWDQRRAAVLRRDGYRCRRLTPEGRCTRIATECDHIIPGDDHSPENLQALCVPHHREKTNAERPPPLTNRRPREGHPAQM